LALSNLFGIATGDEQVSVMQGVITAFAPLQTRRTAGAQPQVYVLDASTNNPGAAGGALVDWQGRLLGMLGKERKSQVTGTWLNYALPTPLLETTVQQLRSGQALPPELPPEGEAHTLEELGIVLIPDVLPRTPPYLDGVRRDSPAERAGLRADDLLVLVEDDAVDSAQAVVQRIGRSDRFEPLTLTVLRGGQLSRHTLPPAIDASPPAGTEQP
jgi:serine protease Do